MFCKRFHVTMSDLTLRNSATYCGQTNIVRLAPELDMGQVNPWVESGGVRSLGSYRRINASKMCFLGFRQFD